MILPKFNRWLNRTNGLVISVHDTWSTYIILESLIIYNNSWKARIRYRIQDHFGLDDNDITHSLYKYFRIFRLWFSLQRWNDYGYKPFITEIDAIIEINGLEYE